MNLVRSYHLIIAKQCVYVRVFTVTLFSLAFKIESVVSAANSGKCFQCCEDRYAKNAISPLNFSCSHFIFIHSRAHTHKYTLSLFPYIVIELNV